MVDALVVPVGGGGMVAGIAITIKVKKKKTASLGGGGACL